MRVVLSTYLMQLLFLPAILIPACASSSPVLLIKLKLSSKWYISLHYKEEAASKSKPFCIKNSFPHFPPHPSLRYFPPSALVCLCFVLNGLSCYCLSLTSSPLWFMDGNRMSRWGDAKLRLSSGNTQATDSTVISFRKEHVFGYSHSDIKQRLHFE